jgi:uncharacterized GH25 family protein
MRTLILLLFAASSANAAITGTLITEDGKPLAAATIEAFATENSRALRARLLSKTPERTPVATTESAQDGSFSINPKGARLADIAIRVAGRQVGMQLPDGEDAGTILVPSQALPRVRILAEGKPLREALVVAGPFTTRTDSTGMADLPETMFRLPWIVVIHPEYVIHEQFFGETLGRPLEITLNKGTAIRGHVVGTDGTPMEHAAVMLGGWPLAESDVSGSFTIAHAPSNWRTIVATAGERVGVATTKKTEIRLSTGAMLTGTVRDTSSGRPVPGVRLDLSLQSSRENNEFVVTDEKGNFSIAPLVTNTYRIFVTHPDYAISATEAKVESGSRASITIAATPLMRVRGGVIDEERRPVGGALVWFAARNMPPRGNVVVTSPSGQFVLRANVNWSSVPQPFFAAKAGYALTSSGPLSSESLRSNLTITLVRGFPLQVKVVNKQRQPIAGASVNVFKNQGPGFLGDHYPAACDNPLSAACHKTAPDGSATYRVTEGKYEIHVTGEAIANQLLQNETLTARSSPLVVEVDRGVEISGRVTYADGTPVTAIVSARTQRVSSRTSPDGVFTLKGFAAGPAILVASSADQPSMQSAPIEVTAPAQNVLITLPKPGRIEGRVVDKATRQPIREFLIAVALRNTGMRPPSQFHSEDGTFVLDPLAPGPIDLRVIATGYVHGTLNDLAIEEGKAIAGLEVQLERGGKLVGRVTAAGQPLSGVAVRLGASRRSGIEMNATTTDGDGEYALDGLPAGERSMDFTKPGYLPKRKSVEVATGKESRLDVEMERGRDLAGRVVDSSGRPLSGARIGVTSGPPMNSVQAFSDAEGLFKLEGLVDSRYTISATKEGYVTAELPNVQVPSSQPITLTLDTGGTISGRVIGLSDAELATVTVTASGSGTSSRTQVDAGGTFTIRGVSDGRVALTASISGARPHQSAPKYVEVISGLAPPVEIDFSAGVTVRGLVSRMGSPVSGGNVSFSLKSGGPGMTAQIATDGRYEISGLPPGDYNVYAFTFRNITYQAETTITSGGIFDIDIRGGTLRGRVLDATTGAPLADTTVFLAPSPELRVAKNTITDSEGKFVIEALPGAKLEVRATHDQYAPGSQSVVIASGTAPEVEIRLNRGSEAIIRIVDAQSGSLVSGGVSVFEGRKNVAFASSQSDDGTIRVWLAPGTYKAHVYARGYIGQPVDLLVPGSEVRVALARGGSLMITSREGGRVRLTLTGMTKPARGISIARGASATIEALMPGRYRVEMLDSDGVSVKKDYFVDVIAGQTARLMID